MVKKKTRTEERRRRHRDDSGVKRHRSSEVTCSRLFDALLNEQKSHGAYVESQRVVVTLMSAHPDANKHK